MIHNENNHHSTNNELYEQFQIRVNDYLPENECLKSQNISSSETFNTHQNNEYFPIFELKNTSFNSLSDEVDEDKNEQNKLYFFENSEKKIKASKDKFHIELKQFISRKRGRKKKKYLDTSCKKTHNKYYTDNLRRKIQTHFLNFMISFINQILCNLKYKERFENLDYNLKKNINKDFFNRLKNKKIGDIISEGISSKLKKKEKNFNKNLYDNIKQNKNLNEIFSEKYFRLFNKIYYRSNRLVNLEEYGLNMKIELSESVKMYKDLLSSVDKEGHEYKTKLIKCTQKNFLDNSLFNTKKK